MVDTNSDPREVDYVIPANDDASKSIDKILSLVTAAVIDGLSNRTSDVPAEEAEEAVATPEVVAAPEVVAEVVSEEEAAPAAEAPATEE
jgi:small subunit ribosomal protein S2